IASSIGSITDEEISSGLAPGSDKRTLTVAGSAFGKRSTPRSRNEKIPSTTSDITSIVAKTGRRTHRSESMFRVQGSRFKVPRSKVPRFGSEFRVQVPGPGSRSQNSENPGTVNPLNLER